MRIRDFAVILIFQLVFNNCAHADARVVTGIYRNPAEGYAIRIPKGLKAIAGDQSGPERGVSIHLPSGNTIVTIGEPNSAEYKDAQEGVRASLHLKDCPSREATVTAAGMGKLVGAKGRLACGNRVLVTILTFRPHGEPIYWLKLETDPAHEHEDDAVLELLASSFRIIRWE
jgi:hypothetical protein